MKENTFSENDIDTFVNQMMHNAKSFDLSVVQASESSPREREILENFLNEISDEKES